MPERRHIMKYMRPADQWKAVGVIIGAVLKLALWGLVAAWLIAHW